MVSDSRGDSAAVWVIAVARLVIEGLDGFVALTEAPAGSRFRDLCDARDDAGWTGYYQDAAVFAAELGKAIGGEGLALLGSALSPNGGGDPEQFASRAAEAIHDSPGIDLDIERLAKEPAFAFFVRVFIPCVVEYEKRPQTLFAEASEGQLERLEELLRIDPAAIFSAPIAAAMRRGWLSTTQERQRSLAELLAKDHAAPSRAKRLIAAAGFISAYAESLGTAMTAPQIRELFDESARKKSKNRLVVEPELPASPEALSKAIQRARRPWRALLSRSS